MPKRGRKCYPQRENDGSICKLNGDHKIKHSQEMSLP